jgi:hypothetical protein
MSIDQQLSATRRQIELMVASERGRAVVDHEIEMMADDLIGRYAEWLDGTGARPAPMPSNDQIHLLQRWHDLCDLGALGGGLC